MGGVITAWDQLPLVVEWEQAGALIHVTSYDGVKRAIKVGHLPEPNMTRPMRWSRADLQRHLHFPPDLKLRQSA